MCQRPDEAARMIDLDPDTVSLLVRHRTRQLALYLRLGVSATASDRVFTNEIGDPLRPGSIGQASADLRGRLTCR